jgi:integrase
VWWIRYYRNGKRHEESSHSTKKTDAERLLKQREGAVANGEPVSAAVGRLKFDAAVADVVADYRVNGKKSIANVEGRIALHLAPYFGGRRMASITTADVRAYVAQRQTEGAANATINRELEIVRRAFRLAEQAGTVLRRPHVPMLREDNARQGFFERSEFEAVRDELPPALRGVATFAYLTGWRAASEILPLEWKQVDRAAQVVRLEPGTTKNTEGRTLPYGALPELVDLIEAAWAEHRRLAASGVICPRVFHRDGAPIRSYRKAWEGACERAGFPGRLMHDFRRTAVRNLVRAGVPDTVAMRITGHKTRAVFDRYNITSEADLRDAVGRLAGGAIADAAGKQKGNSAATGRVRRFTASRK